MNCDSQTTEHERGHNIACGTGAKPSAQGRFKHDQVPDGRCQQHHHEADQVGLRCRHAHHSLVGGSGSRSMGPEELSHFGFPQHPLVADVRLPDRALSPARLSRSWLVPTTEWSSSLISNIRGVSKRLMARPSLSFFWDNCSKLIDDAVFRSWLLAAWLPTAQPRAASGSANPR